MVEGGKRTEETLNGVTLTRMGWCRKFGVNYGTLYNRMKRGWSFETALKTPPMRDEWETVKETIGGETRTRKEWLKASGQKRKTVYERMKRGESFESAIGSIRPGRSAIPKAERRKTIGDEKMWREWLATIGGVTKTRGEWCEYAHMDEETVYRRMADERMTFAEALTDITEKTAVMDFIRVGGKSLGEIAGEKGVSERAILVRLTKGYPPEVAVMTDGEFEAHRRAMALEARRRAASEGKDYYTCGESSAGDTQQLIDVCLSCEKEECNGRMMSCLKDRMIKEKLGLMKEGSQ